MPGPELLLPARVRDYGPCSEAEEPVERGRVLPVAARQECARAQQWSSQPHPPLHTRLAASCSCSSVCLGPKAEECDGEEEGALNCRGN